MKKQYGLIQGHFTNGDAYEDEFPLNGWKFKSAINRIHDNLACCVPEKIIIYGDKIPKYVEEYVYPSRSMYSRDCDIVLLPPEEEE